MEGGEGKKRDEEAEGKECRGGREIEGTPRVGLHHPHVRNPEKIRGSTHTDIGCDYDRSCDQLYRTIINELLKNV